MGATNFALNSDLAIHRYSTSLAVEIEKKIYFAKFMGESDLSLFKIRKDLEKGAGDKITYGLRMKIKGDGAEGDNIIEGTDAEEALSFYSDSIMIDQRRKGTKSKGKMSEQRVPYSLRIEGRDAIAVWFAEDYDEQCMMYLAAARGIDTTFHVPIGWTGRAGNSLVAPDSAHYVTMGTGATAATATIAGVANQYYPSGLTLGDTIDLALIERLVAKSETMDPIFLQPFMVEGEKKFVLLMHTFQAYDLRKACSENDWVDIHKHTDKGKDAMMYQNSLGEYAGVILHKHRNVIRFDSTVHATYYASMYVGRALFLGAQAGCIAWGGGQKGVGRYSWNEDKDDRGNALAITAGAIYGVKKSRWYPQGYQLTAGYGYDFGVITVDGWCKDPNA